MPTPKRIPTTGRDATEQVPRAAAVPDVFHDPAAPEETAADLRERQAAFDAEFVWDDKPLFAYTSSRDSLFLQLRVSMGAPSLEAVMRDIDAFQADAIRILWLCHHAPDDWAQLRMSPHKLQARIDEWGDTHIPRHKAPEAVALAINIYAAAFRNRHAPAPATSRPHGDDLGN